MLDPLYLLDANVLSEGVRKQPNTRVTARIEQQRPVIATASIVLHELLYGAGRLPESLRRRNLESYIAASTRDLYILPYDEDAAQWHARERVRLVALGRTPPFEDGQIAAIAATNGMILVTFNTRDFSNFEGLQIEDWRT